MLTITSLKHPSIKAKIIAASKAAMKTGYPHYVVNRKGEVSFRVGYINGQIRCFMGNTELTAIVAKSF